jgi:hypothetical protein
VIVSADDDHSEEEADAPPPQDAAQAQPSVEPVWCVVANIVPERPYGPGGAEKRRGTKHFRPGAKVYCFPALWGDGYEQIKVVGRHRRSNRYVTMVIKSAWLENWRVKLVYSPDIIRRLDGKWNATEESRLVAEAIAQYRNTGTVPHHYQLQRFRARLTLRARQAWLRATHTMRRFMTRLLRRQSNP